MIYAEIYVLLGYDAVSLGNRISTLRDTVVSRLRGVERSQDISTPWILTPPSVPASISKRKPWPFI